MSHNSDNHNHDAKDITCLEAFDHLYTYLQGELDDTDTRNRLEYHLKHCRSCYSRSQMEKALNERLKKANEGKTPESLQQRLRDLVKDF